MSMSVLTNIAVQTCMRVSEQMYEEKDDKEKDVFEMCIEVKPNVSILRSLFSVMEKVFFVVKTFHQLQLYKFNMCCAQ